MTVHDLMEKLRAVIEANPRSEIGLCCAEAYDKIDQLSAALQPFADAALGTPYAGSPLRSDYRAVKLSDCIAAHTAIGDGECPTEKQ